jgi:hypothetical protein
LRQGERRNTPQIVGLWLLHAEYGHKPESPGASRAFLRKGTGRLPGALSRQAAKDAADAAAPRETPPGYFDVLATSLIEDGPIEEWIAHFSCGI